MEDDRLLSSRALAEEGRSSSSAWLGSDSLTRRLLAVASNLDPDHPSGSLEWNHGSIERMNHDLRSGIARSRAVDRLRQRIHRFRSPRPSIPTEETTATATATTTTTTTTTATTTLSPTTQPPQNPSEPSTSSSQFGSRNLVGILHHLRTQRQHHHPTSHPPSHTLSLYCGLHPNFLDPLNPALEPHPSLDRHPGCGRLITVRATLLPPKSEPRTIYHCPNSGSYLIDDPPSFLDFPFVISDTSALPNAVDPVDGPTQQAFDLDPSNPFQRQGPPGSFCTCQKSYLGCLSCGNIVGHLVNTPCQLCLCYSLFYSHHYYLNRVTPMPRYINTPIPFHLDQTRVLDRSNGDFLSWLEALRLEKDDIEAGYVADTQSQLSEDLVSETSPSPSPRPTLSARLRSSILIGSIDLGDHRTDEILPATLQNSSIQQVLSTSPSGPSREPNSRPIRSFSRPSSSSSAWNTSTRSSLVRSPAIRSSAHHPRARSRMRTDVGAHSESIGRSSSPRPSLASTTVPESSVTPETSYSTDFPRRSTRLDDGGIMETNLDEPHDDHQIEPKEEDDEIDLERTMMNPSSRRTRIDSEESDDRSEPSDDENQQVRRRRRRISLHDSIGRSSWWTKSDWSGDICAR